MAQSPAFPDRMDKGYDSEPLPDNDGDFADYDIAITHRRNADLKNDQAVQEFYKEVQEHKTLLHPKTWSWFGGLPFRMRQVAIPLFVDECGLNDNSVDYQLHPNYSQLRSIDSGVKHPHTDLLRLSVYGKIRDAIILKIRNATRLETWNSTRLETRKSTRLVIGIGRLFVNVSNGKAGRVSKWTGYEVFVDENLSLWMVFDYSLDPRAAEFYPQFCGLADLLLLIGEERPQDTREGYQSPLPRMRLRTSGEQGPYVDIACFLRSLCDLAGASFRSAKRQVQATLICGDVTVRQVERNEVNGELYSELLTAVLDRGQDSRNLVDLLYSFRDNLSTIENMVSERTIQAAVENEYCGDLAVIRLLNSFEDKVRQSISSGVIASAARNNKLGDIILTELLRRCEAEIGKSISRAVIQAAAQNKQRGGRVLRVLFRANAEAVDGHLVQIPALLRDGNEWLLSDVVSLMDRLNEIGYPTGYLTPASVSQQQTFPIRWNEYVKNQSRASLDRESDISSISRSGFKHA